MAPYTPTAWVNDKSPDLMESNLNKLTNELELQASQAGVLHTLPNWADGTVPGLTEAAPWNEMERVLAAVATAKGLSYTATVWSGGWEPTRNAYRLNRMETQAAVNRTALDQQAAPVGSPLGWITFGSQVFPPSNTDKYGIVVTTHVPATIPSNFTGLHLRYRSAVSCQANGDLNISQAVCDANNWEMRTSGGVALTNAVYGGLLGDPGNVGYQEAWCQATLAKLQESTSFDGFWADDATPTIEAVSGTGVRPAQYPNDTAYGNALVSFAQYVRNFFVSRGYTYKSAYNNVVVYDNTGSLTEAWYAQIGPHVDYCAAEYWMTPDLGNGTQVIRKMGNEWFNAWDGWRRLHNACIQAGCGFQPLSSGVGQIYVLASFLLDYNGSGRAIWATVPGYGNTSEIWNSQYAAAASIGAALGVATPSGNVWTRLFSRVGGGTVTVTVDPVAGTASIS